MAGAFNRRCDNPICRRIVMISDRGRIGDAFGSVVETSEHGVPEATCPSCKTVTAWPPRSSAEHAPPVPTPLAGARLARLAECIEADGHTPVLVPVASGGQGRAITVQQVCTRCGLVYGSEGFI